MKETEKVQTRRGASAVRLVSILYLATGLILGAVMDGAVSAGMIVRVAGISASLVLLVPWGDDDSRHLVVMALLSALSALLLQLLGPLTGIHNPAPAYWACATFPLVMRFFFKFKDLSADRHIMTSVVTGMDMALTFFNMGIAVVAISWNGFSFCCVERGESVALRVFLAAGTCVLYVFLFFRSITRKAVAFSPIMEVSEAEEMSEPVSAGEMHVSQKYRNIYGQMKKVLEESQPFLNQGYTVEEMARDMGTNRSYVSNMIKQCTGMNFSQLMNKYRVDYSMELFKKDPRLKVSELSAYSGFGNTVSFGMAFKLFMDMTPKEWCDRHLGNLPLEERKAIQARNRAMGRKPPSQSSSPGG